MKTFPWVIVDELVFSESSPWMPPADGLGYSLHRTSVSSSAADPASWRDGVPSPGTATIAQPDLRISTFELNGSEFLLGFNLLPNTVYILESTPDLSNVWKTSAELENESDRTESIFSTNTTMFYRLRRK